MGGRVPGSMAATWPQGLPSSLNPWRHDSSKRHITLHTECHPYYPRVRSALLLCQLDIASAHVVTLVDGAWL